MRSILVLLSLCAFFSEISALVGVHYSHAHYKGAKRAHINDFPYMVSIQSNSFDAVNNFSHTCGGTIIKANYVMTAAHCIHVWSSPSDFRVVANIDKLNQIENAIITKVAETIVHPDFKGGVSANDIALLRLEDSLEYPILAKLPTSYEVNLDDAILIGWELSEFGRMHKSLHKIKLPVITFSECRDAVISMTGSSSPLDIMSNICTANVDGHVCNGDSGGPLIQNGYVVGIASWISGNCGFLSGITVFTRVSSFLDFIDNHINQSPDQLYKIFDE